jgi:hypothetical protein
MKTALLLWDQVHVIAPWEGYRPNHEDRSMGEAFDLMGVVRNPTVSEKRVAHDLIEDFVTRPLPRSFTETLLGGRDYSLYAQKLLPETWDLLNEAMYVRGDLPQGGRSRVSEAVGLTVMSLLADSCAGTTLKRVTDRADAYANLSGCFLEYSPATPNEFEQNTAAHDQARQQLLAISLSTVDVRSIPMERLLDMRQNETSSLRDLRHRLNDHLEDHARVLAAASESDAVELKRQFADDTVSDYDCLSEQLKLHAGQLVFKDILACVVAGATAFNAPHALSVAGGVLALGGVIAANCSFVAARKKLLIEHPTAYLYEIKPGRLI